MLPRPLSLFALAALLFTAARDTSTLGSEWSSFDNGRLSARIVAPTDTLQQSVGVQTIPRDSRLIGLYIPHAYRTDRTWPLLVLLHGSEGNAVEMVEAFQAFAESAGVVIVAPKSRDYTWDRMADGSYGSHDVVLPIAECSALTAPELRFRGYQVEFVEYLRRRGTATTSPTTSPPGRSPG